MLVAPAARAASTFYITGAGNGHGIGMSQYGAYGYALHGWGYRHILGHYFQGTGLRTTDPTQTIRVLLDVGSSSFTAAGGLRAPRAGKSLQLSTSQTYSARALAGGSLGVYDSSGKQLGTFRPPLIVTGPGPVDFVGHGRYRGALELRWADGRQVQTVNALDLDDYVRGVISAEMPAGWSAQALEAQAVASRTYALTTSVNGNGYRLYSDTRSQMYRGLSAETPSTDAATAATRGQVVTLDGNPVVTYFSASSGGHTESIQNVWLGSTADSWLRGVPDTYDGAGGNPYYRWSVRMTMAAAASRLGSLVRGAFRGITVTKRGVSPRVVNATVDGSGGGTSVTGPRLQSIFGLMSTYMSFGTISTTAGDTGTRSGRSATEQGLIARLPGGFASPRPPALVLRGRVSGAGRHAVMAVQRRLDGRWQDVMIRVPVRLNGTYSVRLPSAGRYRVVYRGLFGPAVSVR